MSVHGIPKPPDWTLDALCAEVGPDVFFVGKGRSIQPAKAICAACPVSALCLEYALTYEAGMVAEADWGSQHGVYGGMSPVERRNILRKRAAARRVA